MASGKFKDFFFEIYINNIFYIFYSMKISQKTCARRNFTDVLFEIILNNLFKTADMYC